VTRALRLSPPRHDGDGQVPVFAICVYLAAVFWAPQRLAGTKPLKLRRTWAAWNLALSLFSIVGASRTVPTLLAALREHGFRCATRGFGDRSSRILPRRLGGAQPRAARHTASRRAAHTSRRGGPDRPRYTFCTDSKLWYLGPAERPCGLWMTLFIFSKIPELMDTIFLVVQQKEVRAMPRHHHIMA
jgi:hypothetical protein